MYKHTCIHTCTHIVMKIQESPWCILSPRTGDDDRTDRAQCKQVVEKQKGKVLFYSGLDMWDDAYFHGEGAPASPSPPLQMKLLPRHTQTSGWI